MRIAIVNDMPLAVEALRRVVVSVPDYEIAWVARDGDEAVRQCAADEPDVILMDLVMPKMSGTEATRVIMRDSPCAILVVTATVDGHIGAVFEAMGSGALDVVQTPSLGPQGNVAGGKKLLAKIATIGKLIGKAPPRVAVERPAAPDLTPATTAFPLVAVGASTGGPKALAQLLGDLPRPLPAAVVIVQHVDVQFAPGLADWLATESRRAVRLVREGEQPAPDTVWLAATNDHLVLTPSLTFAYCREPLQYPFRPSVDVFFKSVVAYWKGPVLGVLLTGMGSDGVEGLLAIRQASWHTIAQDRDTSIVYGMPKAAAERGAAVEILPLERIAGAIARAVEAAKEWRH